MHEINAQAILASVMEWTQEEAEREIRTLSHFAKFKYDNYERYNPGRRFIESLALWLNQMDCEDRNIAYQFVKERLIYVSNVEMAHLVQIVYPDIVDNFLQEKAAEKLEIPRHKVAQICSSSSYQNAQDRSLFLGMSDGARTHELRRFNPQIKNDQVYHAYDPSKEKFEEMLSDHRKAVGVSDLLFEHLWLLDDFSGSGLSYIRKSDKGKYKGKIPRIMAALNDGTLSGLFDKDCTIHIVIYVLSEEAESHIKKEVRDYANDLGLPEPYVQPVMKLKKDEKLGGQGIGDQKYKSLVEKEAYYDSAAETRHTAIGGDQSVRYGFNACALPLVLEHNTPNNSIYLLWGSMDFEFFGLFPRVNRHS